MIDAVKSSFARGELSEDMALRDDVDHYGAGAEELTNVVAVAQGGVELRELTRHRAALGADRVHLVAFEFNTSQAFLLALSALVLRIYTRAGALVATLATPYTADDLFGAAPLDAVARGNTVFLASRRHQTRKLFRYVGTTAALGSNPFATTTGSAVVRVTLANHGVTSGQSVAFPTVAATLNGIPAAEFVAGGVATRIDSATFDVALTTPASSTGATGGTGQSFTSVDLWTLTAATFVNAPQFNFEDALSGTVTDEVQEFEFTGTWANGDSFRLKLDAPPGRELASNQFRPGEFASASWTPRLAYSTSPTTNADTIRKALQDLPVTSSGATIDVENTSAGGTDPKGPYRITFTGADGGIDWPEILPTHIKTTGGGLISIAEVTPGGAYLEATWSAARGYPGVCAFTGGRLILGSSTFLPAAAWGSVVDSPEDFNRGESLDDQGFDLVLGAGSLDSLVRIVVGARVVLLSGNQSFALLDWPVTPRNALPKAQTQHGAEAARAVVMGGAVCYIGRGGKQLWKLRWDDASQQLAEEDLVVLASHMLKGPRDMAIATTRTADRLAVVNGDDGTLAVLTYIAEHGVVAWSRFRTRAGDAFDSLAVLPDETGQAQLWASVRRSINGADVYRLEQFDAAAMLDAQVTLTAGAPTTTWAGLDAFTGATVRVFLDGVDRGTGTVVAGVLTTTEEGTELVVGFEALATCTLLPPAVNLQSGPRSLRRKRIVKAAADFLEAANVAWGVLDDEDGLELSTVEQVVDETGAVLPLVGQYEETFPEAAVRPRLTIRQTAPGAFRLRGVAMQVEVLS